MAMTAWTPRVAIILSIVALKVPEATTLAPTTPAQTLVTKEIKLESWNWNYYARSWAHLGSVQSMVLVKEHDYVQEHASPLCHQEGDNATFGFHGATTWVKDGCRGDFTVTFDTADTASAKFDRLAAMCEGLQEETELLESTLESQNATILELTSIVDELTNPSSADQTTEAPGYRCDDSDYPKTPCGVCGRPINVDIRYVNSIKSPTFTLSQTVTLNQQPLIRFMEEAVELNSNFRFSATYYPPYNGSSMGYFIDTLNKLGGNFTERTYWQILSQPTDVALDCGVSSYIPENNEIIMFNFTTY